MAPPSRDELSKLKLPEIQRELESRGLDGTGKKGDLVERLWTAMQQPSDSKNEVSVSEVAGEAQAVTSRSAEELLRRLRLIREREEVEAEKIRVRAQAEQNEKRLVARSEQLELELQLADLGQYDEAVLEPLRVKTRTETESAPESAASVLSSHVKSVLLPPTELRPFTGDVKDYRLFMRAFETRIASKTDDQGELLFYLEQFTKEKPNQLVKGCLHLGESGFAEAKRLLEARYGSPIRLIDSYADKVRTWPRIAPGDVEALDQFVLFLTEVMNAMTSVQLGEFDHPTNLRLVLSKVPVNIQDRWLREADSLLQARRDIRFRDLVSFLTVEVRVKRSPLFGLRAPEQGRGVDGPPQRHKVSAAQVSAQGAEVRRRCHFCGGTHQVSECRALFQTPWEQRRRFLLQARLCFGCLREGHRARSCRRPLACGTCGGSHPTVMHREQNSVVRGVPGVSSFPASPPRPQRAVQTSGGASRVAPRGPVQTPAGAGAGTAPSRSGEGAVVSASLGLQGVSRTTLPIVPVRLQASNGREVVTNAFLDQGSSGSFLTDRLAVALGVHTERTRVSLETVGNDRRALDTSVASGVQVSAVDGASFHPLPPLLTIATLPVTQSDRCRPDELRAAAHLCDLNLPEVDAPVELLLGSNCAPLIAPREVRSPPPGEGGLCAIKTCLGWYVIGRVDPEAPGGRLSVNLLRVQDGCAPEHDTDAGCVFKVMYEHEFKDLCDDRECLSVEDREWLSDVLPLVKRDDEGHFEVPLPKADFGDLPDSYPMALRRLNSLRRRFDSDPSYFDAYRQVISSLVDDGYAVPVPEGDVGSGPVWYLPHHGVLEPEKGKLRVVFDCAAQSRGVCLNDLLRRGPVLTNPLLGVLSRFREGRVAFTCDIQSMYHRVHVPPSDSDLLRFLWFDGDCPDGQVSVFKMRSHVFGALTSSSVASLALMCCAEEGRARFPEAADALLRKTYVDDTLCATDSVESAVQLAHDLKELCGSGAFNMTKFISNSAEFLKQMPYEDRGKNVKAVDLDRDALGSERALGLKWSVEDDCFVFQFSDRRKQVTRRGVLSTVSSVFDPLGIVSPVILRGRVLLQRLCADSCGWDEPLSDALSSEWEEWLAGARELDGVHLERNVMGPPGEELNTQLHVFADASETAYAAVAYLRRESRTADGDVRVSVKFLMGKSLVNPVRFVSVPRLELVAAVLAVRLRRLLLRELDTVFHEVRMWTDSMVVLSYIRNRTTRFKTFVANRLGYIHGGSQVGEWAYVPSSVNPADVGSRGCRPTGLEPWLKGPEFLLETADSWPEEPVVSVAVPEAEVKSAPVALVSVSAGSCGPFDRLVSHFSSFFRMKRAVAWYRRFLQVLRNGSYRRWRLARQRGLRPREHGEETGLTVSDLSEAERVVLRYVQSGLAEYPGESCDDGPIEVRRSSPLSKLHPQMRNGLLVVGGRLDRSQSIYQGEKHPVILPRKHHVTRLVIREAHERVGHEGRDHTFWEVRRRFWVIGAGAEVRSLVRSCVTCRKVNARPQQQLMAELPRERVSTGTSAFCSVLLDVFGPIMVKTGRSERKRYGLMCVCVLTRGVHVEILDSLRTDSLINAVRRICARRGQISQVRSDMGTNLTGADRELREALSEVSQSDLQRAALQQGIDWTFNPPTASHFAGGVERQIRTFRKIWRSMPQQRCLDEESLRTLFCEIESIMNGRPLTYVSTSPGMVEPLTPGHLLFLRGSAGPIPGEFSESDLLSRRRWRQVQYLAQQFWYRWKREYLLSLQARQKWMRESRNVQSGDVVLLADQDVPRGRWRMGRVVEAFPSQDGLVRKALVKVSDTTYLRPISKLVVVSAETDLDC